MERTTARTVCGICNGSCGMLVTLEQGRVVAVRGDALHPVSRGYLCPKGLAVAEMVNAPDRLRRPLRKKPSGEWEEISWEDAVDFAAERLSAVKECHGAEAVAVHVGQPGVRKEFTPYMERFCQAFGTPNFSTSGSHCHLAKVMAGRLTYGGLPTADFANSNCIALWGYNPQVTNPPLMRSMERALAKGARLIVIDPRTTPLARRADIHLQPRPGTDGALALGMLHVVVGEKLYDQGFVERWTTGFDQLVELVAFYPLEKVAAITGVDPEAIGAAARLYAGSTPACSYPGISLDLQTNGVQSIRAIAILQAITGNLDVAGGARFVPPAPLASLQLATNLGGQRPAIGQERFPLFQQMHGHAQSNLYADAILEGAPYPLKALVVSGSNPAVTWPNAGKVKKALGALDFLAVMDNFPTESSRCADLVLPAAHFLERNELWDASSVFGVQRIGLAPQLLVNQECRSDWEFWCALAKRLGFARHFPWENELEAIGFRLQPMGLTVDELRAHPEGIVFQQNGERKYEKNGFATPSGKVELYSEALARHGYDPLPAYREPAESPLSTPELAGRYPLIATTAARNFAYFHSRYRNIPSLKRRAPQPVVEMHPETAAALGVVAGDRVTVASERGSIELAVAIMAGGLPGVVSILHGWQEANSNYLTDDLKLDPISGFPADCAVQVRIVKLMG